MLDFAIIRGNCWMVRAIQSMVWCVCGRVLGGVVHGAVTPRPDTKGIFFCDWSAVERHTSVKRGEDEEDVRAVK